MTKFFSILAIVLFGFSAIWHGMLGMQYAKAENWGMMVLCFLATAVALLVCNSAVGLLEDLKKERDEIE